MGQLNTTIGEIADKISKLIVANVTKQLAICNREPGEDCPVHPMTEENQRPVEDEGRCRFNCRTQKEAFFAGVDAGTKEAGDYYLGTPKREEMYREYKQESNTRREGIRKTQETSESRDIF